MSFIPVQFRVIPWGDDQYLGRTSIAYNASHENSGLSEKRDQKATPNLTYCSRWVNAFSTAVPFSGQNYLEFDSIVSKTGLQL